MRTFHTDLHDGAFAFRLLEWPFSRPFFPCPPRAMFHVPFWKFLYGGGVRGQAMTVSDVSSGAWKWTTEHKTMREVATKVTYQEGGSRGCGDCEIT